MANEGEYSGKMPRGIFIGETKQSRHEWRTLAFEFLVGEKLQIVECVVNKDPDMTACLLRNMADEIFRIMQEHRRNQENEKKTART